MKILNLTNLEQSEIKYRIDKFPDGQQNVNITSFNINDVKISSSNIERKLHEVTIISHLNNWLDLELIVCTVACLRELGIRRIHLVTPYFVGARSDRKFEEGGNWYLKQVICPVINNLDLESILVLDPHSWVLGNSLNYFKYIDNGKLVEWAIKDIGFSTAKNLSNFVLVAPDAGASHKIQKVADRLNFKGEIIICSKERDAQGVLNRVVVPINSRITNDMDYVIVDDICDGGRTFINIASAIRSNEAFRGKIYLIVTHGIFSAGFKELSKHIDGIYCTNSFSNIGDYAGNEQEKTNVKQLNVY